MLEGEPGWDRAATVVTDGDQRRERAFGNNDESLSAVMTATEPWRIDRTAHDFPAGPGGQVVAEYDGLESVTASSAQGYADNYGPVLVPGRPGRSDRRRHRHPVGQLARRRPRRAVAPARVRRARPVARGDGHPGGGRPGDRADPDARGPRRHPAVRVDVNTSGAPAVVQLDGSEVDRVEVRVIAAATADRGARVGLREVAVDGLTPRPDAGPARHRSRLRGVGLQHDARPPRLLRRRRRPGLRRRPDPLRPRRSPASTAASCSTARRTLTVTGHVVARSTPEAARLLDRSSAGRRSPRRRSYGHDPRVAPRFAYDGPADHGVGLRRRAISTRR